jgi:phosphate transport system substrate-binding protein
MRNLRPVCRRWACKPAIILLACGLFAAPVWAITQTIINGAGATFPAPIYSLWLKAYRGLHPEVQVNYEPVGSGAGIRRIMEGGVDFGASDAPMTDKQIREYKDNHGFAILHFPTVVGAAVPAYNLPGAPELNFTPEILAGIYLGSITKWSDPMLREANPKANLPSSDIMVLHRSDGSGTTYVWSDYLSKVSDAWRDKVGKGTSLNWPVGLGARGNDGVSELIQKTRYSLGYVELSYAVQKGLSYGAVRNASGDFIKADLASVAEAATEASQNLPDDFRVSITNAPGKSAYPICSFSWLLVPAKFQDPNKRKAFVDLLTWELKDGLNLTQNLVYARLPERVVAKELAAVAKIQ